MTIDCGGKLDRLDALLAEDKHNSARPDCASKTMLNRDEMDRYNAWWDRDTILAQEARATIPALVAEVRRLRRGVEHWPCVACDGCGVRGALADRCVYCDGTGLDKRARNLLAGREWSDNGEGK